MSYIRVDDDGMAQYYIERGIKVSRGTLSMGNSHEGASDCVADPYGVKRNEICLTLYVFRYSLILSLLNGLTRFV